ncbi:MAG: EAL domain-containing protein [Rhodoferax sp.]|nr:EAL domain-containing protein [Rhodoferax sp.]
MTSDTRFALLEGLLEAVCLVDARTLRIVAVNQNACDLVGLLADELVGRPVLELTATPEDMYFWEDVAAGQESSIHSQTLMRHADGDPVPVERRVSQIWLSPDELVYLVGLRDLRAQRAVEAALEQRLAELRATLESTGDGILVTDTQGRVNHYNRMFVDLWAVPDTVLRSTDDAALWTHMAACVQDRAAYQERLDAILADPQPLGRDVILLRSGKLLERHVCMQMHGERRLGRVFAFRDLTERLEAQKKIETLAHTDALTGLPNRLMLAQRADLALHLAQRHGGKCAVLFIDLDRFKNINDSLGHHHGDQLLQEVARRVAACLREVDTLSRVGADEFVVFLQDADALGAEVAARRILGALAQAFLLDGVNLSQGCSMGIALYPGDGNTLEELIRCSETAMHTVKERGRGNFRFYQPQMNVDLLSRMKLDHAMRNAMEQGLFRLHYQPQVALHDGGLLGVEALVRWTDPELGQVPPSTFIPLAEESGFIIALGNWVLEESVAQAKRWHQAGTPVVVSVNVSAMQFQQTDFVERVAHTLRTAGLPARLLELELTESILLQDANEALARLHALAHLGLSLAIDDFGTGYSSLAYLKKFPIGKLKIDRAFVMGLPEDESDRAIVSATIAMAKALKLAVVAEGVETIAQQDYLRGLGCEAFQGYLCSPAVAAADLGALLSRGAPFYPTQRAA